MSSPEVRLDHQRRQRIGLSEAVFCAGKSQAQLQFILDELQTLGIAMLFTRLLPEAAAALRVQSGEFDYDPRSHTAVYQPPDHLPPRPRQGRVVLVTGGSADLPVAREAARTLDFHGEQATLLCDLGVAGLWRLQQQLPALQQAPVIICVAGMDAALPTVLAGLVPALVIAVPTSVGYGTARQGETALNALLCSCAQGLVVVNIDNGFGAACAALRALAMTGESPA